MTVQYKIIHHFPILVKSRNGDFFCFRGFFFTVKARFGAAAARSFSSAGKS